MLARGDTDFMRIQAGTWTSSSQLGDPGPWSYTNPSSTAREAVSLSGWNDNWVRSVGSRTTTFLRISRRLFSSQETC